MTKALTALSRTNQPVVRKGQLIAAPLAEILGDDDVRRLAIAVRAVSGIESLVWVTDVASLTREQAVEQMGLVGRCVVLPRRG